jgi:methyl-accepting chemotaxis protein
MTWRNILKQDMKVDLLGIVESVEDEVEEAYDKLMELQTQKGESNKLLDKTYTLFETMRGNIDEVLDLIQNYEGEPTSEEPKEPKSPQSEEIKNFLEEIEDYATQQFEQAYSPDDDDSIETAQEYYKMLEYLETTNYTQWDLREIKRKFPIAFMMVEEAFGWTGRLR